MKAFSTYFLVFSITLALFASCAFAQELAEPLFPAPPVASATEFDIESDLNANVVRRRIEKAKQFETLRAKIRSLLNNRSVATSDVVADVEPAPLPPEPAPPINPTSPLTNLASPPEPAETESPTDSPGIFPALSSDAGPVDRLGLADNLYAIGEYQLAIEMYQQTERERLPVDDQQWIDYQMATCHRRLHQLPQAQEVYRRLASEKESTWLVELSRWWLDRVAERIALQTEHARYEQMLNTLNEVLDAHSQPTP